MEDGRVDVLRTAIVLVLLLALGYGVWVVLNHDGEVESPSDFPWGGEVAVESPPPFEPPADGDVAQGAALNGPVGFAAGPTASDSSTQTSPYEANPVDSARVDSTPPYASQVGATGQVATTQGSSDSSYPPPPPGFGSETDGDQGPGLVASPAPSLGVAGESYRSDIPDTTESPNRDLPNSSFPATGNVDHSSHDHAHDHVANSSDAASGDTGPAKSVYGGATAVESVAESTAPNDRQAAPSTQTSSFRVAMQTAQQQIKDKQPNDALYTLSLVFGDPGLSASEKRELLARLDPLAGQVIYSTRHLLEPAYQVQRGEDLFEIAKQMKVPHQLLQNINGIKDPSLLRSGSTLKVVRGPFRAEVDLSRNELILFLGKLYAGRFPVTVGNEPAPRMGEFEVRGKEEGKSYYGPTGATFEVNHPNNPYGRHWLDLGSQLCIHGTSSVGDNHAMGCVSLSPIDARDVYGILSVGSRVIFRR
jgi:lipoprotein-anchoring transpeptidase ErfK/SrfK